MHMTILPGVLLLLALTGGGVEGKLSAATLGVPPGRGLEDIETRSDDCPGYCNEQWNALQSAGQTPPQNTKFACCKIDGNNYCACQKADQNANTPATCNDIAQDCCRASPGLPCNNDNGKSGHSACCHTFVGEPQKDHCDQKFKLNSDQTCRNNFCQAANTDDANNGKKCDEGKICCGGSCVDGVVGACCECIDAQNQNLPNGEPCGDEDDDDDDRECCCGKCVVSGTCPPGISCQCSSDSDCSGGNICCGGTCVSQDRGCCIDSQGNQIDNDEPCSREIPGAEDSVCCGGTCTAACKCPCVSNSDCSPFDGSRLCCGGHCRPHGVGCECASNGDCDENKICCSGFCTSKADGCCTRADGTPVSDGSLCVEPRDGIGSGICCDHVCQPSCITQCPICTKDCECTDAILSTCVDGQCSPTPPEGCCPQGCGSDEECCGGKCVSKAIGCCIENGEPLSDNTPCSSLAGRKCCHGRCEDVSAFGGGLCPACLDDCHCPDNKFCCPGGFCQTRGFGCDCDNEDGLCQDTCGRCCLGVCRAELASCPECFQNSDCGATEVCCVGTGTCESGASACPCVDNDDCQSPIQKCCLRTTGGTCIPTTTDCPECVDNDDCPGQNQECCDGHCGPETTCQEVPVGCDA